MKLDKCQYDLETTMVDACDSCRITRFRTHQTIRLGRFKIIVTKTYETKNCFKGFAPGDLINAFSLLPKEEQELEIIRRAKYSTASHEERSVESEFEAEFQNTTRVELGASQDFNSSESAGGGFDLFGLLEADASASASQHIHLDQNFFNETIFKTGIKVSSKYDVAIDHKSEVENKFRSLRKIVNPNPCRVVTFFFKQLNKKYSVTVRLVSVHYDIITVLPPIYTPTPLPHHIVNVASYIPRIFPVRPPEPLPIIKAPEVAVTHALIGLQTQSLEASIPVNAKVLYSGNEIRPFKRLSEAQLLAKAETHTLAADEKKKLADFLKSMNNAPEYKPGIIYTTEYCIRTHNIIAEPKVSECSICDCNEVGCGCKDETPTPVNP